MRPTDRRIFLCSSQTQPDPSLPPWRFDFAGAIVAPDDDRPTTDALHHHGDEPNRAGYTIAELMHLACFLASRVIPAFCTSFEANTAAIVCSR